MRLAAQRMGFAACGARRPFLLQRRRRGRPLGVGATPPCPSGARAGGIADAPTACRETPPKQESRAPVRAWGEHVRIIYDETYARVSGLHCSRDDRPETAYSAFNCCASSAKRRLLSSRTAVRRTPALMRSCWAPGGAHGDFCSASQPDGDASAASGWLLLLLLWFTLCFLRDPRRSRAPPPAFPAAPRLLQCLHSRSPSADAQPLAPPAHENARRLCEDIALSPARTASPGAGAACFSANSCCAV